jgi:hypothetical protein
MVTPFAGLVTCAKFIGMAGAAWLAGLGVAIFCSARALRAGPAAATSKPVPAPIIASAGRSLGENAASDKGRLFQDRRFRRRRQMRICRSVRVREANFGAADEQHRCQFATKALKVLAVARSASRPSVR